MLDSLDRQICKIQGRLFELSFDKGYDSESFITVFMKSETAKNLDSVYNRMQWAGEEYLLEEVEEQEKLIKSEKIFDKEVLFWTGYLYRYWHYYKNQTSKKIIKFAPAKIVTRNYFMFHTLDVEKAIDNFIEMFQNKK